MQRVWFIHQVALTEGGRAFDPATDLVLLEERLSEMEAPALLIVDPIVNAVAGDSHKNGEVRRALDPLVKLAERYDVAVLGISHFSKGTGGRDPTERVTGSIAFGALARVVMVASRGKPEDDGSESDRMFMRSKSNIGRDDGGYAYALEQVSIPGLDGIEASVVRWRGAIEGSAREALAAAEVRLDDETGSALREAEEFLLDLLAYGPVAAAKVQEQARAAGHAFATVKRAKAQMGVTARKLGMADGWAWSLPEGDQAIAKKPIPKGMGTFGINDPLRRDRDTDALE
jgi:putative DNA primase/helicase